MNKFGTVCIDEYEYYDKKSFRNRMHICDSNGLFRLTVPLEAGKSIQTPLMKVAVANEENWQAEHWRSIVSAYNRSPFFEFYKDELEKLYEQEYQMLYLLNRKLLQFIIKHMQIQVNITYSSEYIQGDNNYFDARSAVLPNTEKSELKFHIPDYQQVFSDRLPFQSNVSSLDLLFNQGPSSASYLNNVKLVN